MNTRDNDFLQRREGKINCDAQIKRMYRLLYN